MPAQLSDKEMSHIDRMTRGRSGVSGAEVLRTLNAQREKKGVEEVTHTAVYKYMRGETHARGKPDKRGAKKKLTKANINAVIRARRRLIQKSDGNKMVLWKDAIEEADLDVECCEKTITDACRALGCKFRPARAKVQINEKDAKARRQWVLKYKKKSAAFWVDDVDGYLDCKNWCKPLTEDQRKRYRQTKVHGHLRFASEGTDRGFTKPRQKHSWIGIPSINVAAVVSVDRIILWDYVEGRWNGEKAHDLYAGPIAKALTRVRGDKRKYTVVEDGDRKGFTSKKGKSGKVKAKIKALTLPPRTPSLMPLDYALWSEIDRRMAKSDPASGRESEDDFKARLKKTALSLPRGYVKRTLARMRANILALGEAKGYTPKND
jgi:hypothetical protein